MERLTQRLRTGEVLMASEYEEKYTEQEWISVLQDRIAAYEDTHMMPSDVMSMRMDMAILTGLFDGIDVDRMREIVAAERDGRVVVLPYRIGATVYVLIQDSAIFYPETNGWYIGKETIDAITQDGFYLGDPEEGDFESNDEIGKTVFLTREEAEAALEATK